MGKIKIGISACLLGEKVRYDGGHKLDHFLADTLGKYVDWVPVCPEVEYGLTVPREAMRLTGDPLNPRLVTRITGINHTEGMMNWAAEKLVQLEKQDLCGFIFKSKSPSSGMTGVKVYSKSGAPVKKGVGIFAKAFMDHFPFVPAEDDGRLHDPAIRENFIERVFVFMRWKDLLKSRAPSKELAAFHADHKLLIMSHSPDGLRELGRLAAWPRQHGEGAVLDKYFGTMMRCMKLHATVRKNVNVLQHVMGYFKKQLTADEKKELLEVIGQYHRGLIPLIVPVTLLRHYVRKYDEPYLKRQRYLNPHPVDLMLRNHV